MNELVHWLMGIFSILVAGFASWTVTSIASIRGELSRLELHVSEEYLKKGDINELTTEVRQLSRIIYQIAGKLGIDSQGHA